MSPTAAAFQWSGGGLQPYYPDVHRAPTERITLATGNYAQGQLVGPLLGTDEVDLVNITGSPTGGTFTVSVTLGTGTTRTTSAIPLNSSPAVVAAAINALVNVLGDAYVEQGQGNSYRIHLNGPTVTGHGAIVVASSGASLTGGSTPLATASQVTAYAAGTAGSHAVYNPAATNGTQNPTHILMYAVQVDASGNVAFTATASGLGEWGQTELGVPAYYGGAFLKSELTGLDAAAIAKLGRMLNDTIFVMYS